MDGVNIGVQEYRAETSINPKTTFKDESVTVDMGKLERTRFTRNAREQKALISLVVTQTGNFKRDCKIPKLSATKSQKVLTWALKTERYQYFSKFLIWCDRIEQSAEIPESFVFYVFFVSQKGVVIVTKDFFFTIFFFVSQNII